MANVDEIGRIADAVVAIRTEWPVAKVADYLEANHARRPFDVLAAAAVFVAADPFAKDLTWLEHPGYWWIEPPGRTQRDPETQRTTRKRDEAWWANFNMAQSQRRAKFGEPPFGEDAEAAE